MTGIQENVRLASSDSDEDLYSGYNEYPSAFSTKDLEKDEEFQEALRTSYGKRPLVSKPGTALRLGTAVGVSKPGTALRLGTAFGMSKPGTPLRFGTAFGMSKPGTALRLGTAFGMSKPGTAQRLGTAFGMSKPGTPLRFGTAFGLREGTCTRSSRPITSDCFGRPMSALKGAGYSSQRPTTVFDPFNLASKLQAQHELKMELSPEEKVKKLERRIMELVEEACVANSHGEHRLALDKAKEASSMERNLIRLQEQSGLTDMHNLDLTFSVIFNLANQYEHNEMYTEALSTYQGIIKNRVFPVAHRLRVNMGNIYCKLRKYPKAIKMYRMALDQEPNSQREFRIKIMHNIGIAFMKMGQINDACSTFEYIMQEKPEFAAGLHVILCHRILNDKDKMKKDFQTLLEVPLNIDQEKHANMSDDPTSNILLEVIRTDSLSKTEKQLREESERCIITAAKVISPVIESSVPAGYDWCLDTIKASRYPNLANDLEINKAVMYIKQGECTLAIDTLKALEKVDRKVASTAATNLAFIYYLLGDIDEAEKYAEQAKEADSYNSCAFVNLGNCCLAKGDLEKAKGLYVCALENDSSCVEALYNLGLVNKRKALYDEALECFLKLHNITKLDPEVLYQLAHLYELLGDVNQATEWYLQVLNVVPSDSAVLQRMGEMFDKEGDKQQALQYYYESYRFNPSNVEVINWLGCFFIEMHVPEKSIRFFERAALICPEEVKWRLMIASCHRRSGNYQQALSVYKDIHKSFPEDIACLKFLVRLCTDLGFVEAAQYANILKKVERAKEERDRIGSSRLGSLRSSPTHVSSRAGGKITDSPVSVASADSFWNERISADSDQELSSPIRKELGCRPQSVGIVFQELHSQHLRQQQRREFSVQKFATAEDAH